MDLKIVLFLSILFPFLLSCNKDEYTKEREIRKNIVGEWAIQEYNISGVGDVLQTTTYTQADLTFEIDGDFIQTWYRDSMIFSNTGEWFLDKNDLDMQYAANSVTNDLCGDTDGVRELYKVARLTDTQLELEGICDNRSVSIMAKRY